MGYTMPMLSLFPQILFLAPFGTTLLRIAAGAVILLLAWKHFREREKLAGVPFVIIGKGAWIPLLAALVELATAAGLILGIYTQAAAIFGMLLALKSIVWKRRYPAFFPLSQTASFLLFVICLSILITGAGVFAFDLPL